MGVPLEDAKDEGGVNQLDTGMVHVIFGSANGLTAVGNKKYTQASPDMAGLAESDDLMGWSLTTGDYNNDGRADLCIGVPGQDVTPGGANCGGVITLKGSATGLVKSSSVFNTENSLGLVSNAAAVMGGGVYGP